MKKELDTRAYGRENNVQWLKEVILKDINVMSPHDVIKKEIACKLCEEIDDIDHDDLHMHYKDFVNKVHTLPISLVSHKHKRVFVNKKNMFINYQQYLRQSNRRYKRGMEKEKWSDTENNGLRIGNSPVQLFLQEELSYEQYVNTVTDLLNHCDMLPNVVGQTDSFIEIEFFPSEEGWRECDWFDLNKPGFLASIDNYMKQSELPRYQNLYFNFDVGNPAHVMYNENTKEYKGVGLHDLEFRFEAHWFILPVSNLWYFVPDFKWTCKEDWNDVTPELAHNFLKNYWGEDETVLYKPSAAQYDFLVRKSHI